MTGERKWIALVTFERRDEQQNVLPNWAQGACGYILAFAPCAQDAAKLIIVDLESQGLHVVETQELRAITHLDDIESVDKHLGFNFENLEPGKLTVWGTIHCYKGEGEA